MGDLLQRGSAWLSGRHETAVSQQVTYRRGSASVVINATVGTQNMNLGPEYGGTQLRVTDKDFIVNDPSTLILNSVAIVPTVGDLIEIAEGGVTNRYAVRPPTEGEPEFSWDTGHTAMRIHAKFLRTL